MGLENIFDIILAFLQDLFKLIVRFVRELNDIEQDPAEDAS